MLSVDQDPQPSVRFVAASMLEDEGFQVLEAADGREAVALLEAGAITINLVFSDTQMPGGLDGCDLARWVRRNRPGMRVILASGRVCDDALPADLLEVAPILAKPYRSETLTCRVRTALSSCL